MEMTGTIEPLMTPGEVAARLGIHKATVYRRCSEAGGLRAYRVGGCIRFKPEDVEEYLERCFVRPSQDQRCSSTPRFQYKPGMRVVNL